MVKTGKRRIRDGKEFNRFFAKPTGENRTVKREARLKDTLKWMKRVIADTLYQTKAIASYLQGESEGKSCKRIWNFCFSNFQYEKDEMRKEQIRTPNRAWWDRKQGIDCDCFTVLIGSILTHLGIPYVMRMTRYEALDFEHIYPVALTNEGEVIIDAVVHKFNYEVPYTEKEDVEMDLEVLSGVKQERFNEFGEKVEFENELPIDAEDLFLDENMDLEGLEGKAEREARKKKRKAKKTKKKAERKQKREEFKKLPLKERVKKRIAQGFHVINRLNPGAALLRGGILASMKLNLFKVASHLRFAYWNAQQAKENDMDMRKFNQLQRIREKIEKIYFGAGGKTGSLKKSILTGRGNRNKMVRLNGLGEIIDNVTDDDDLRTILGEELFDEELNGFEGLFGFGAEPSSIATGAAITSATGIMGTIAALIKKIGSLFKKGSKNAENFKIQDNADNEMEKTRKFSFKKLFSKVKEKIAERRERKGKGRGGEVDESDPISTRNPDGGTGLELMEPTPEDEFILEPDTGGGTRSPLDDSTDSDSRSDSDSDSDENDESWLKKNGKWFWPVTGLAALGIGFGVYKLATRNKKKGGKAVNGVDGLDAAPKKKKKSKAKSTTKRKTTTAKKTTTRKTKSGKSLPRSVGTRKKKTTSTKKSSTGLKRHELM